jgi:type IV pilus assembly protein PilN
MVAFFWYTQVINNKIEAVQEKTKQVDYQIAKYKEKADRVAKIKKDLKLLKAKLKIVKSLKKQRSRQFILFDAMTDLVVKDRMWLTSFKTDSKHVTIKGIAFDNPTIADFMKKLEKSKLFDKVDLKTSRLKKFKGDVMLKSFELLCRKTQPKKKAKSKKSKKGRK